MITKDNLISSEQAREGLLRGIFKVAHAVGSTMGTGGSNAIIEAIELPGHLATNDGYSIANSIVLADPVEEMGRKILVESINRANKASGDGSSTTCVLTAAIIEEGMKMVSEFSPMEIKNSLEDCLPTIEKSLTEQKRELYNEQGELDLSLLKQVATISAEDESIGQRIADIYKEIGKTGIISWDISKTAEDHYSVGTGITINGAGYFSPYMCDATESGQNTNRIRIKNPKILVTKQKITSASDFDKIGASLFAKDIKDLVVFVEDVDPLIIPDIIKTRAVRGFRFVIIKMPVLWKDQWYEDLALTTGATVIDPAVGLTVKNAEIQHLGVVDNIVITKDDTFLDGIRNIDGHVEALKTENTDDSLVRAARLNTKTARYFVGAQSDSALSYRRLKVEDAIAAAYHALNGGIVAGGGVALASVKGLPYTIGGKILGNALTAPMSQIISNAGGEKELTANCPVEEVHQWGFNTRTKKMVNMFEAGIVDPYQIVLNAVKNAISVAATVLTVNTVVLLPRDEQQVSQ